MNPFHRDFARGFRAVVPLWLGVIPFAFAYAVTARNGGLSLAETQLMSLLVFAGGSQFSAAGLFATGASGVEIILTTFLLNVRHVLYGMSLTRQVPMSSAQRLVAAHFLTDEAYGVTLASGESSFAFLLGAELSLFLPWNVTTGVGALAGQVIPDPSRLGVDFVFPLAFLALLIPLLKGWTEVLVAAFSGLLALALSRVAPGGVAVLVAGVAGSLLGALFTADGTPSPRPTQEEASP
ncbi:AzlC family ABC transporter permease [Vitiosangium sp. GDMCC 1.1324]|uniref:AzlC family ABC transporter permease n=1 Tax=Vitiosangium sp. (strain GDMCC 1.1324) TaxID=2138576 RepID=UPI000D3B5376|nr:AzlC family ABC transporter permease [Vitiosangium sp. GDMCC 1.1324]PTL84420.1 branched-chain amino acid permease [Vitiosangium sp. GDMCC 1.1324]